MHALSVRSNGCAPTSRPHEAMARLALIGISDHEKRMFVDRLASSAVADLPLRPDSVRFRISSASEEIRDWLPRVRRVGL